MQQHSCTFINSFPDYVLDRTIVINGGHEHQVSGYKLARASSYFKRELIQLRRGELERSQKKEDQEHSRRLSRRARARSLCDLEPQPLQIAYEDVTGLEAVLSFIHSTPEVLQRKLPSVVSPVNVHLMLKAGLHFEVPSFLDFCLEVIQGKQDLNTTWQYWRIGEELSSHLPALQAITSRYLLTHFLAAAKSSDNFLEISSQDLQKLLRDDGLQCSRESQLFPILVRWIEHDVETRGAEMPSLLNGLRLGRLTQDELMVISSNPHVQMHWDKCSPLLTLSMFSLDGASSSPTGMVAPSSGDETEAKAYFNRSRLPYESIFVVGGWEGNQDDPNFGPSRAIQIYDPRSDTWRREDLALDEGHAYSGCVLYKNCIYVVGGYVSTGPTQTLKKLDLTTCAWKYLSPMHEKRNYVSTCLLNESLYALGGHNGRHRLNSVERYDPDQNHWAFIAAMLQVRSDAGADAVQGRIYVVGGFDGHHFYDSVEMYDPKVNQWSLVAPMQNIRSGVSVVAFKSNLFAIGGNDGLQRLRTVERYDPETNQWQNMPSMIRQRSNFCVAVLEDKIYVMGGWSDETNSTISLVERWQPSMLNSWEPVRELYLPASANCCCSVKGMELIRDFSMG
ncbi:unnamed protein product [Protopolystoma xenopodis]|uniref:BACK domain-containing protein n=1 Tax=Protopolystoma xenopodis TaxID=117903 RepID=A0A448XAL0_9PLAT|nr:unnamed protein product [Protopolystoma xenopodis]